MNKDGMSKTWRSDSILYKVIAGIVVVIVIVGFIVGIVGGHKNKEENMKYNDLDWLTATENSFNYKNKQMESDESSISINFEMHGIDTIGEIIVNDSCEIEFECRSQLTKGKAKLILVSELKEVVGLCEGVTDITKKITLEKGIYRIKLVGDNAAGKIMVRYEVDDKVQINTISNHIEFDW